MIDMIYMIGLRIFAISMRSAILSILFILSRTEYSTDVLGAFQGHHPTLERDRHRLGAALHAELAENMADVRFDRVFGEVEPRGDRLVAGAGDQQPQHFQLARGQILAPLAFGHALQHPRCDPRLERRAALYERAHAADRKS